MVIAATIVLLIISALISQRIDFNMTKNSQQVFGHESPPQSPSPAPSNSPASSPVPTQQPTFSKTDSSISIKQEVKDDSSSNQNLNVSDFRYPSSTQISSSDNNLKLESSGDPQVITDWYKEKIRSLGFKSKSFIQTSTNGNVLNKLVGGLGDDEVKVDIEKKANENKTYIIIVITT